jgi:hypothetical protein
VAQNGFKAFLQSRRWSDELGRKFLITLWGDNQLPDARSWQELEAYLKGHNAPGERIEAAEYVWQLYVGKR